MSTSRARTDSLAPTAVVVVSVLLACAVAFVVSLLGRPAHALGVPAQYHVVHVDEREYGFTLPSGPLPSGRLLFVIRNRGTIDHELVMFKTKSAAAPLPLRKNGSLNEESPQISDVVDTGSSLKPGETRWITADLDPGTYVIVCNLPAHFHLGMRTAVTVR